MNDDLEGMDAHAFLAWLIDEDEREEGRRLLIRLAFGLALTTDRAIRLRPRSPAVVVPDAVIIELCANSGRDYRLDLVREAVLQGPGPMEGDWPEGRSAWLFLDGCPGLNDELIHRFPIRELTRDVQP